MANLRTNNLSGEQGQNAYRGSVFFDGSSKLSVPNSADVRIGSNDFTLEAWVRFGNTAGDWDTIIGMWDAANTRRTVTLQRYNTNGELYLYVSPDGGIGNAVNANGGNLNINDWHHVAGVRDGNTLRVYQNGVQVDTVSFSSSALNNTTDALFIGNEKSSDSNNYNGFISNVRFVNGTCIYPNGTTFTPPQHELTLVPNTVVLACQDSNDPTQEATGKTITGFGSLQSVDDTELITNSGFTTDISGWTASGVQWSHSSGALMHYGSGNTQRNIYQDVTTVIGKKYVAKILASSAEANTAYWQIIGASEVTVNYIADNNNGAQLPYQYFFTADATTTRIRFYSYDSSNSGNVRSYFYLASIKLAEQGEAPKVIPPVGRDAGNAFGGPIQQSTQGYMYFPTGRTEERGRGRGLVGGGNTPGQTNTIQFVEIRTSGNSLDFGDLTAARQSNLGATASSTRGIWGGGQVHPANSDVIDFITIATQSNASDFGNLSVARRNNIGTGNQTRGLFAGGQTPTIQDVIDYVTIASVGNATDFGNLSVARKTLSAASSPTRGLFFGGTTPSDSDVIDYVTIASAGNATDFGNLTVARYLPSGVSSNTRAAMMGGGSPSANNTIDFVTIATTGNATDFGDLITAIISCGSASNSILGLNMGGGNGNTNTIEFITIATTGNAADYGDLYLGQGEGAGCSDSHGGLT